MAKCDFNKAACNFIEITLRHGCSPVNLLHIFRAPFPKNTSGWLLLKLALDQCKSSSECAFQVWKRREDLLTGS